MKKTMVAISLLSTLAVQAQVSPLDNYEATNINEYEMAQVWKNMRTDFDSGSECFNRAMSWTYDTNNKFGYNAKKILIHYSYKYNQELSAKWGFHIAPVYNVNGEDTVLDKGFQPWVHAPLSTQMWEEKFLIAGTEKLVEKRIKLIEKITKLEEAIRDMDKSAEYYYDELKSKQDKIREAKQELKDFGITDEDLKKQRPLKIAQIENWIEYFKKELSNRSLNTQTVNSLKFQLKYQQDLLKMVKTDLNYAAHIKCKQITNIEELDYNQNGAWCFIQKVSQFYWGVPQLRLLNYGPGHGMNSLPMSYELPSKRKIGAQYASTTFDMNEVWTARKQAFGSDYKEIWKTEYDLKEGAEDAVKDIAKLVSDIEDYADEANELVKKAKSIVEDYAKLASYITKMESLAKINNDAFGSATNAKKEIYNISDDISVSATKKKVDLFYAAEKSKEVSKKNIETMENTIELIKLKIKDIDENAKEEERERRRRERDSRRRNR